MGNIIEQVRVAVEDLRLGMYVAELDRPWLDTPFTFQGFTIASEEELALLRQLCRTVMVDVRRSGSAAARDLRRALKRRPAAGPTLVTEPAAVRAALRQASGVRQRAGKVIHRIFTDVRLGRSIDADAARAVVEDMVTSVAANADALLWLTNLKNKDEYTHLHSLNVCVLSLAFGRFLGVEREPLEQIGLGALLHDIGKMYTPDEILNKPGALTPEEWEIMRRHPGDGYELMVKNGQLPPLSLAAIRDHHERVTGGGYPRGLSGIDVPTPVMVVALADVYDAVTSDRAYRRGMSPHQGLNILYKGAEHYGRELVEEFIRCLGIYPVGSVVTLANGVVALVVSAPEHSRLLPVVLQLREADGRDSPRRLVNLAEVAELPGWEGWQIRKVVDPHDIGADLAQVVREEIAGYARA